MPADQWLIVLADRLGVHNWEQTVAAASAFGVLLVEHLPYTYHISGRKLAVFFIFLVLG